MNEISNGFAAAQSSLLCHALLVVSGEDLPEPEVRSAWKDYGVVDRTLNVYPIEGLMGRGRYQCYFGHADPALIARFQNQARGLYATAREILASLSVDFGQPPFGMDGWLHLCYCMAWEFGHEVKYQVESDSNFTQGCFGSRGPFVDRETFSSWSEHSPEYAEGVYFGRLSFDVRSCSGSAIDAILRMVNESETRAEEPRRRDPATEARDKWIYEEARKGVPLKNITIELRKRQDLGDDLTSQRVGQIVQEYASRHHLPRIDPARGRRPKAEPRRTGRAGTI
jgi:hypothetical protein